MKLFFFSLFMMFLLRLEYKRYWEQANESEKTFRRWLSSDAPSGTAIVYAESNVNKFSLKSVCLFPSKKVRLFLSKKVRLFSRLLSL